MFKKTLLFFVSAFLFSQINAQNTSSDYQTAIGLKFYPGAISVKHFIKSDVAIEGLGYFWEDGFRVTGLYEFYGDIPDVNGLKWYAGPGAHIGGWSEQWKKIHPVNDGGIAIGIDGVLGLDYKFTGVPINISLDWQPSFNFVGYNYFEGGWGGIGIRYTIK